MKYDDFRLNVHNLPLIDISRLQLQGVYTHALKVQIMRWHKQGKLIKLRNRMYVLRSEDRKIQTSRVYIAAEIYKPSYISMEYALFFYGLIPEKVTDITCITTKKTMSFSNHLGKFIYQHLKPECFTGFIEQKDETNLSYFMAKPEKAVVDFIYLNMHLIHDDFKSVILDAFRFQNMESLNADQVLFYSGLFTVKKLDQIIKALIEIQRNR